MAKSLEEQVEKVFSAGGNLSKVTTGYVPRQSQIAFAKAVANSIETGTSLIVEAGTGTGKTFAYLVPALIHGGRVVVSTAGKTLQDQLYEKDVPAVLKALGVGAKIAVLKGRNNYICRARFDNAMAENVSTSREEVAHLQEIKKFLNVTKTGEKSDVTTVPENSGIWRWVTSTSDNCIGRNCPDYDNCFVMRAREKAREADVLIINHHLFLADMELSGNDYADFLPDFDMVIFDEAHQIPSVASSFFADSLSLFEVKNFAQEAYVTAARLAPRAEKWKDYQTRIYNRADDVRLKCVVLGTKEDSKLSLEDFKDAFLLSEPVRNLSVAVKNVVEAIEKVAEGNEELQLVVKLGNTIIDKLNYWDKTLSDSVQNKKAADDFSIKWLNVTPKNVTFSNTKLSYADKFKSYRLEAGKPWVLTSATLSVQGDFKHFVSEMGLEDARSFSWESPFHYASQGLMYIPRDMCDPKTPDFPEQVVDKTWPLIKKNQGRAFILCTTHRAVSRISEYLRLKIERDNGHIPVLVQNEAPKNELIRLFREHGNAVLVGSMSFWEGVDIKGDSLSMVIIDKIPFAPPDDPVYRGKANYLESQNLSSFRELSLPEAIMTLKQGAGRLIRDHHDRGMLVICDVRILTKNYGGKIWNSLPDFARTANFETALSFLEEMNESSSDKIKDVKL